MKIKTLLGALATGTTIGLAPLPAAADMVSAGQLTCRVAIGGEQAIGQTDWRIELDESIPLAVVDDSDLPADYSVSHVRIRLAIDGPVLTIGRISGRIVATDRAGKRLGFGHCSPQLMVDSGRSPTA